MESTERAEATPVCEAQDMRRTRRYKINLHVMVSTLVRGINKLIPAYGRNLGEGGICLFVPAQLALGDLVELVLSLPGAKSKLAVRGRVKSVERFNYSIEFTGIDERTRQAIADSCRLLGGAQ
jgi:Tfp pilus assembly protein PilZ